MKYDVFSAYICALMDCGVVTFDKMLGCSHNGKVFHVFNFGGDGTNIKVFTEDAMVSKIDTVHYVKDKDVIEIRGEVVYNESGLDPEGWLYI